MKRKMAWIVIGTLVMASAVMAVEAIQVQMSSDGNLEGSLIRADVKGDVLNFQVVFKNISTKRVSLEFTFRDVYYMDPKEKKKYFGLKDSEGAYIAGPVWSNMAGGVFRVTFKPEETRIFWIKCPAPPVSTDTVDFHVPHFLPFDDVRINR